MNVDKILFGAVNLIAADKFTYVLAIVFSRDNSPKYVTIYHFY